MLDHIATSISKIDVGFIAAKFNVHTAEIESYEKSHIDLQNLFLVQIQSCDQNNCLVYCAELNTTIQLSFRNDVQVGQFALVRRQNATFVWEMLKLYSATKEGLFPVVDCPANLIAGGWKQHCEESDYILDVDNKSINHRPDLWGHRGIAREVAAFMGWQLKPLEHMLANIPDVFNATTVQAGVGHSISIEIQDTKICSRFAALYCDKITHKPSQIWMAMRLARVDSKPINTIVDITNYVMFDISQPMHVFDAANFPDKKLTVRRANEGENLELLDGKQVSLVSEDIVITDGKKPVALAGVMGGKLASFTEQAQEIIIEAGAFQAAMVRQSAARVKMTTEASVRFAKQLDPMQNTTALLRFVALAQQVGVVGNISEKLVSVGKVILPAIIELSHTFIENRLGIVFTSAQIVEILQKLSFQVEIHHQDQVIVYHVTVPTLRITKDITLPEDIVEEIARVYGFENIAYCRPVRAMKSFDMSQVMMLRKMKEYCAFSMKMHEIRDYLFYDESFLKRLDWYPNNAVAVKNPVSENWKVLVTSLVPHLIKNIELNMHAHEQINVFEHNSVWCENSVTSHIEHKALAGIFFGHKTMTFYDYKAQLEGLFAAFNFPVTWAKSTGEMEPWFDQLQVADIMLEGIKIGRAGMISAPFIRHIAKGAGFAFELHADLLIHYKPQAKRFIPWSKYQAVAVDISMLVDVSKTAEHLEALILQADEKIDRVSLLDFFEKAEWAGKRSLTFRYRICDFEQNVTKEVIENITNKVIHSMLTQGAQIR